MDPVALAAGVTITVVLAVLAWRKAIRDRRDPELLPGDRVFTYVFPWIPTVMAVWFLVTLIRG
jgi:hypothetical protein